MATSTTSTAATASEDPKANFAQLLESPAPIPETQAAELFQSLRSVEPEVLIGEWDGFPVETGHPGGAKLMAMRWTGKTFRSIDDADPIVVLNGSNEREAADAWGSASIREMKFRGRVSAAMVYDSKPIFDHFRLVDTDTLMGAMEAPKVLGTASTFYFYLSRRHR